MSSAAAARQFQVRPGAAGQAEFLFAINVSNGFIRLLRK